MSNRKFFSGLPAGMMQKQKATPNRQQTHFYWPDEAEKEEEARNAQSRMRNRSMSAASLISQSQASTDTEESRRRRTQQNQSRIEFYDMIDTGLGTDTESVCSKVNNPNRKKKQETLKSRIEFYDFVDKKSLQNEDDVQSVIEKPVKKNSETFGKVNASESIQDAENEITKSFQFLSMSSQNGKNSISPTNYSNSNNQKITQSSNFSNKNQNSNKIQEKTSGVTPNPYQSRSSQSQNYTETNSNYYPDPQDPQTPYLPPSPPRRKAPQYDSYSESDGEERFHRSQERNFLPPTRYPPSQRSSRPQPRRYNSDFFDFDDDGYDRQYDSANRRPRYRKPENGPRMVRRRDYSPELSDEDFYDFADGYRRRSRVPDRYRSNGRLDETDSYFRGRNSRRSPSMNGYGSEMDYGRPPVRRSPVKNLQSSPPANGYNSEMDPQPVTAARPPIKPLTRTMSINEAKQRYHTNLKSNIFHNDPEYTTMVEQRKPSSVREFAASQRVGVGLPDI